MFKAPPSSAPAHKCKRCSKQLDFTDTAWENASPSIDALAQTLPIERTRELKSAMAALYIQQMQSQNSKDEKPKDLAEISRFFSHSFRTDQVNRPSNLLRSANMRGSMALVLDNAQFKEHGKPKEAASTKETSMDEASTHSDTGNSSVQSDSFILLSSSQIHPYMFAMDAADQQLILQQSAIKELENLSLSTYNNKATGVESDALGRTLDKPLASSQRDDIAEKFEIIGRIMDMLSDHSLLSHPMCEDCAETMLRLMDRELADCAHERQIVEGIGQTARLTLDNPRPVAELERELAKQEDLEHALEDTLGMLDKQLADLCGQIAELDVEAREMDNEEDRSGQERNAAQQVLERLETEQWMLDDKYARLAAQLTQLQRTNVFNDVFNITVGEGVASINGFRLGGRSSHSVEWAEINAAWGQALLLLQTVARRLGHEFLGYRLIPMGSFSRIEHGEGVLELFGSGDMYLGRLFQNRRFDMAMVAYLECLDQIAQLIASANPQLRLPYRIDQDKVGGVSIKPQFGQDDVWTRACKNTLMDARWALAFASSYTT